MRINCALIEEYVMQKKDIKHIGLCMVPQLYQKIKYIAGHEGRSINGQAYYLIQKCIREFEKENGPIPLDDQTPDKF